MRSVDDWGGSSVPTASQKRYGGAERSSSAGGGFQLPFPEAEGLDLPSPARGRVSPRGNFAGNLAGQIQSSSDLSQPLQSAMRSSAQPGGVGRVRRLEFSDRIT